MPCDRFEVAFEIAFPSAAIGRQAVDLSITERSFRDQLAAARTFGFVHEVEAQSAVWAWPAAPPWTTPSRSTAT